jgi:hypothetical protein
MDSGDDRSSTAGVGPDWALIPGSASALFDRCELRQLYRDRGTGKFREDFLTQCDALRDTQARQRQELRTAWETRNAERSAALAPFADREATRRAGRAYGQGLTRSRTGDDRFGGPGRDAPKPD